MKAMNKLDIGRSRKGLQAIVGSTFRIKQIQDGKEGVICPFCRSSDTPIIANNGTLHCGTCESKLYDGPSDVVISLSR